MVEGVSNLKVRLGFRNSILNDNLEYVNPEDSAAAAGRVETVEIGLLMQSFVPVAADDDSRTYILAGSTISPGTSGSSASTHYVADRRLRLAFGSTVSVRNRQ
jgi:type IV pilus assembly protein PilW